MPIEAFKIPFFDFFGVAFSRRATLEPPRGVVNGAVSIGDIDALDGAHLLQERMAVALRELF